MPPNDDAGDRTRDTGHVVKNAPRRTAYQLAFDGTPEELLAAAQDPALSPDGLAAIAPGYQDASADRTLVLAVLAHPAASAGVVARYATHNDPAVRDAVARHPLAPNTALDVLSLDPDPAISAAARAALAYAPGRTHSTTDRLTSDRLEAP